MGNINSMAQLFNVSWPKNQDHFKRERAKIAAKLGSNMFGSAYQIQLKKLGEEVLRSALQELLQSLERSAVVPRDQQQVMAFVKAKLDTASCWINCQLQLANQQAGGSSRAPDWNIQPVSIAVLREAEVEIGLRFQRMSEPTGFWLNHWKWIATTFLAILGIIAGIIW